MVTAAMCTGDDDEERASRFLQTALVVWAQARQTISFRINGAAVMCHPCMPPWIVPLFSLSAEEAYLSSFARASVTSGCGSLK